MLNRELFVGTQPEAAAENIVLAGQTRITVLTDRLFRIEQDPQMRFCDDATQAVWYRRTPAVAYRISMPEKEERPDGAGLKAETGEAMSSAGLKAEMGEVPDGAGLRVSTSCVSLVWNASAENSYVEFADGGRVPLDNRGNLSGTYRTLDGCDGDLFRLDGKPRKIELGTGIVSADGVAVLDDGASLVLKADGQLAARENPETDLYVFAYGHDYRGAVKAFYRISGAPPVIPRFALGNWWSRYHAYTEKEYLHTMDRLAKRGVPFTVATVDMDWHWSATLDEKKQITASGKNGGVYGAVNGGWTGYSWNTDLFPDYRRFLRSLHERGLHVTLNLHPADGVRYFEDMYPQMAGAMGVDPASEQQIPFDIADERFLNAYFEVLHHPYEHDGVDFWWLDWQQGTHSSMEGLDPLWALNHYHFLDNGREHMPLILSRYCGAGAHRYPLGFSGDTYVTWETLDYLPYFTATASNIGYTWWSHDIGGHMHGYKDDELYVRFLQFGVFSPIMRLHSTSCPVFTKEPMDYMNGTGHIAEEFLRLRHRMIPFLYSASCETAREGKAMIEPLYYEYPEAPQSYESGFRNQYLFGGQLMAAPITRRGVSEGMASVDVWLPEGHWTDIFTGDEYEGGRVITMVRWLDSIPVLAKAGGFLPLDGRPLTNDCGVPDRLEVQVYSGDGRYMLHEGEEDRGTDQGIWFCSESADDGLQKTSFRWNAPEDGAAGNVMPRRSVCLQFRNIPTGSVRVTADGEAYPAAVDDNGFLTVEIERIRPGTIYEVLVSYEREDCFGGYRERLVSTMTRLQMENGSKMKLYDAIANGPEISLEEWETVSASCGASEAAVRRLSEQYRLWYEADRARTGSISWPARR